MSQLRELLAIRDFRRLWTAQITSDFGDSLTTLSLLILVQRLTDSTAAVAGLMIAVTVPSLIFSILSGVYVDRFDRRKMMVLSDFSRAVLVLLFVFVGTAELLPLLYAIAFAQATIGTLFNPARSALLPRIVGEGKLLAANSVSQTARIIFNLLGTTAAGILASVSDTFAPAFMTDSLTFLVSAFLIMRIQTSGRTEAAPEGRVWTELKSGISVMVGSRPLLGMLVGAGMAMLGLGAVNVLAVPFIIGVLGISEAYFGLVELAQVVGMVLAGALLAIMATRLRPPVLVGAGLVGVGASIVALSRAGVVWQLAVVLFLVGLFVAPTQAGVNTLSQTLIPDAMRGRVGGALNALVSGASVLSMGLAGVAAAAIGVRNVFVLAGIITATAGLLSWLMLRGARELSSAPVTEPA